MLDFTLKTQSIKEKSIHWTSPKLKKKAFVLEKCLLEDEKPSTRLEEDICKLCT